MLLKDVSVVSCLLVLLGYDGTSATDAIWEGDEGDCMSQKLFRISFSNLKFSNLAFTYIRLLPVCMKNLYFIGSRFPNLFIPGFIYSSTLWHPVLGVNSYYRLTFD